MIKFFRKIRQRLLTENRFSKYLVYGIGEIVLVVIGILIALMINDWNHQRLEQIVEVSTLESMKKDFIDSKANIESTIKSQRNVVRYSESLMGIMYTKAVETQIDSVSMYISRGALSYWRVEPLTGTYDALIGSGRISIIKNQKLNRLLAEYSAKLKYGFEDEDYSIQLTTLLAEKSSSFIPHLLSDAGKKYLGIDINYYEKRKKEAFAEHLDNISFLGVLISKRNMENNRLSYQKNLLKYVDKIIKDIDSELELKTK